MRASHLVCLLLVGSAASALEPLKLSGQLDTEGAEFALVGFDVPDGVVEIEVRHTDDSQKNIIDFGLLGPDGFRGWGGGNSEPAVVGLESASRSYLPGPIAGRWQAILGKALIRESPASWSIEVLMREEANLPVHPDRVAFEGKAVLSTERRWYAGDLHTHSYESGDARPKLDEMATFARSRGLDFIALSDHNTVSQLDFIERTQARHPELLFVPSVEFTTYAGHANGLGATRRVSHLLGIDTDIAQAVEAFEAQGAVFSINHPVLDLGDLCIGCAWKHALDPTKIGSVEIGTGAYSVTGILFSEPAIDFWDALLDAGSRAAAVGGSDDHQAGRDKGQFASPMGSPTTLVLAEELSWKGIVEGVRKGRTVVKLEGADDPMVELSMGDAGVGDEVTLGPGQMSTLDATVTGGEGYAVRFVVDGRPEDEVEIDADPFVLTRSFSRPDALRRIRAEVLVDGKPRTVTSHIWIKPGESEGCGCRGSGVEVLAVLGLLALARRQPRS